MRRFPRSVVKIALGLAAGFALLAGGATLALKIYLPPERLRELLVSSAEKALHREVRLKGVSWSLMRGLAVSGLEISEAPDFKAGTFAAMGAFNLKLSWLPLLRKRLVVEKIVVEGLDFNAVRGKDGRFNFSDLAAPAPAAGGAAPAPASSSSSIELKVRSAVLSEGRVRYSDSASGQEWSVSGISAKIGNFSLERPFDAEIAAKAAGGFNGSVEFGGRIDLAGGNMDKASADIRRLIVRSGDLSAEVSGTIKGFENVSADLKARLRARGAELLEAKLAGSAARAGRPPLDVRASISAKTRSFNTDAFKIPLLPALAVPALELDAKFALAKEDLRLETFKVRSQFGDVELSGNVARALGAKPQPALQASLNLDFPPFKSKDLAPIPGVPPGLEVPAAKISGRLALAPDSAEISGLRVLSGKNDLEAQGKIRRPRSPDPALDLLLKCRSFSLGELTGISPETRAMGLGGSGFFALAVTGTPSKPVLAGKLQFDGLGGAFSGLKLSGFTGTAKFDERRIDVPNLKGKVAEGTLALDLTVKDYSRAPDIDLEASLDSFDLGKFLDAKEAMAKPAEGKGAQAAAASSGRSAPMKIKGKLAVGKLSYPGAAAKDLKVSWDLSGVTPDLRGLSGRAKLDVGPGRIENLGNLATQSKLAKVLVFPLMVIQKVGRIAGIRIFPDLNNILFNTITGDYAFSSGKMVLRECRLEGSDAHVGSTGTIDLPEEKLDLVVSAQVGHLEPVEVEVKGTLENPSTKVRVLKLLAEPAKRLIQEPAKQLLKNIFR